MKPTRVRLLLAVLFIALLGQFDAPHLALANSTPEAEPNDTVLGANILNPAQSGRGIIATAPEFDGWVLPNVRAGDFYCMLLSSLTDTGDSTLSIFESAQSISDTSQATYYNDDGGPPSSAFRDSLICGEKVRRTGAATLRVDGFGSSTLNPYELFQVVYGPDQIALETEPNDTPVTAQPIQSVAISATGDSGDDYFSFHANAGERVVVMIDQDPGRPTPPSPFLASVSLIAPDGVTDVLSQVPGTFQGTPSSSPSAALGAVPVPSDGYYFVRVRKASGNDGDYRLIVLVEGDSPASGACCNGVSCRITNAGNCRGSFKGPGTSCIGDTDGDGIANDCDNCAAVGNQSQDDNDGDDAGNACESCIDDPLKISPLSCGCGARETDSDGDSAPDCIDSCSSDPTKSAPGSCGCGVPDRDANANGVADCRPGADLKALIRLLLTQINGVNTNAPVSAGRERNINRLRSQIGAILKNSRSSIAVTQASFRLSAEVGKLLTASSKLLRGDGSVRSVNKKTAKKIGSKIISVVSD